MFQNCKNNREFPFKKVYNFYMKLDPRIINVAVCLCGFVLGSYNGYYNGSTKSDLDWKKNLIEKDFAEYDRRSGLWKFREMEDIVSAGFILNKARPISELLYEDPAVARAVRVSVGSVGSGSLILTSPVRK